MWRQKTWIACKTVSVASLQILKITNRRRAFLSSIHLAIYLKVGIKYEKNVLDILKVAYQWMFITKILGFIPSGVKRTEHSYLIKSYRSFWDILCNHCSKGDMRGTKSFNCQQEIHAYQKGIQLQSRKGYGGWNLIIG